MNMLGHKLQIAAVFAFVTCLAGCGLRPGDGTQGLLRSGEEPLGNIRVTVNRVNKGSVQPVGFGVTGSDGTFRLLKNASRGLRLSPGEYRCTLKSVGAHVRIPNEYAQVNSTPLKVSWSAGDDNLDLKVALSAARDETKLP
jgi:hypothetical protein